MSPPEPAGRAGTRRRRRRLLALPVVAVLLAVSLKLVTMSWFSTRGVAAYADAHYDRSATEFDRLQSFNVVDPWRAHFGSGSALHRGDDLDGAEAAFRRALELAPQRCDVRFNLVVTIEAQGDQLTGGEQRDVDESGHQDGLARYRVALDIADAGLCPTSSGGDAGTRLDDARQRLRAKLGADASDEDDDSDGLLDRDDPNVAGEASDSREVQISQRNQTGAAEREDHSDLDPNQVQDEDTSNW